MRWIRGYSEESNVPPGMGVRFVRLAPGSLEPLEAFHAHREPAVIDDE